MLPEPVPLPIWLTLKFLYHPTLDIARSITEIHPYLEYLGGCCCKGRRTVVVSAAKPLPQCCQFEFHYINKLVGLQHKVYPGSRFS